jgi:heme/copper-type cytochrome/quinol oxidase subunit 2
MIFKNIVLSNWSNGVVMIAIFGVVCLALVGFLVKFMMSGKSKKDDSKE